MKRSYVTALLTLTCLLGLGISSHAQDADGVVVTVPFEFVAGGATLQAGEYRVSRVSPGVNRELAIRGYNKGGAFLLPLSFDGTVPADQPTLSFEHVGGKYLLSQIKTPGGVYTLPTPPQMVMLGQVNAPSNISPSGTR
jgi:hypothetical protein